MSETAAEAREAAWGTSIPAVFRLSTDECTTLHQPPPFYANLPTNATLPALTKNVCTHFLHHAPPLVTHDHMWLDYKSVPVRWQLPVGPLFQLLNADNDAAAFDAAAVDDGAADAADAALRAYAPDTDDWLPLELTVHFTSFPASKLLPASVEAAEALLLSTLKESSYLACGSTLPIVSLSQDAQAELCRAVAASDASAYDRAYAHVRRAMTTQLGGEGRPPRAVPVRVYTSLTFWRQPAVSPMGADGTTPTTLADVLAVVGLSPRLAIVQGVEVPLATRLLWLFDACAHPDGFLYVCCPFGELPE